jgi:VCBS repeat-containing protein
VISGTSTRIDPAAPSDATLLTMFSITPTAVLDGTEDIDTLNWTFDSGAEAFDYLAAGETLVLQYTIRVTDDNGLPQSDTETVTITITGSNDAPVIGGANSGAVVEDVNVTSGTVSTNGKLTINDPDVGESSFIAATINGAYGDLTIDAAGNWSYSAANDNTDIQVLRSGESLVETLSVTTTDGSTYNIVITINGTNEPESPTTDLPDVPDYAPPVVDEPLPEKTQLPPIVIGKSVESGIGENYLIPQIREEQASLDIGGSIEFAASEQQDVEIVSTGNLRQNPDQELVQRLEWQVQEDRIDKLGFQVSDDEELNDQFEQSLLKHIDLMREGIDGDLDYRKADDVKVQIIMGVTTSLTAGIVSWVLRSGSLLASLMSAVPLLNRFDMLPILKGRDDEEDVEPDDDTEITGPVGENRKRVENMFSDDQAGQQRSGFVDE